MWRWRPYLLSICSLRNLCDLDEVVGKRKVHRSSAAIHPDIPLSNKLRRGQIRFHFDWGWSDKMRLFEFFSSVRLSLHTGGAGPGLAQYALTSSQVAIINSPAERHNAGRLCRNPWTLLSRKIWLILVPSKLASGWYRTTPGIRNLCMFCRCLGIRIYSPGDQRGQAPLPGVWQFIATLAGHDFFQTHTISLFSSCCHSKF